jgi:hypothetical protein
MAHVRILQCWISQASKYEYTINNLLPEETKNNEEEALLETWDTFRKALDKAVTLVDPYLAKLPKMEEEGHQKKVKDWLSWGKDRGHHDSDDAVKEGNPLEAKSLVRSSMTQVAVSRFSHA